MNLAPPSSTYRLQLHKDFGFYEAARAARYVSRLGVSHLYVSPIFKAAPGSTHGYDVLDHNALNPELGGDAGFEALSQAAKQYGLGLVVDFVPNHMGVGSNGNHFWEDVLEHGQASEYADFFDIDWQPPKQTLTHQLLLPILPDQYGVCLESGYFSLRLEEGLVRLVAGSRALPLRPRSLGPLLSRAADLMEEKLAEPGNERLRALGHAFTELNEGNADEPSALEAYRHRARGLQSELRELVTSERLQGLLEEAFASLSGQPSQPRSFDFLDDLLRAQNYRLSAWQLALEAVNYRRFFDVTDLASIRVERPAVFEAAHRSLLSLVEQGKIQGIRLDHIDGLFDPIGYLRQLADRLSEVAPGSEPGALASYVIVEKILAPGEALPASFRAHGTTGYEFLRVASGVFVDRRTEANLSSTYRHFTGDTLDFEEHLLEAKRDVLGSLLASDAMMLSRALERIAEQDRRWRDLTWESLHRALIEVMAAFGAYRSYVRPDGARTPEDETLINRAVAEAIRRNPTAGRGAYQFLRSLLLGTSDLLGARDFAMRFQQTTGPVMAKALEDTAFYRYSRNLSDNEVGGRADHVGVELAEFHQHNAQAQTEHPLSMTTTSTHDTKRGEDARARLSMLSELPNTWRRTVHDLRRLTAKERSPHEGSEAPTRSDRYLYYQALVGALPFNATHDSFLALKPRLEEYMLKACREAKTNTSWLHPNEAYEAAVQRFVAGTLEDPAFTRRMQQFCRRIDPYAACKALGQVTLKLCSPGVPDTYQGSEIWHQPLVDPDNRRPVDYSAIEVQLNSLEERRAQPLPLVADLLRGFGDGRLKLFVVRQLLELRRSQPALFRSGYVPMDAGPNALAFGRGNDALDLICVVTRFPFRVTRGREPWAIGSVWSGAQLADHRLDGNYRNTLTGETLRATGALELSAVFAHLPVAVLVR